MLKLLARCLTSIFGEFPPIDLVLHDISPVQRALAQVEVKGNGVSQARYQHAEFSLVKIDSSDFVPVGEYDKRLEGIWSDNRYKQ